MNGKFLLLIIISINIVSILLTGSYVSEGNPQDLGFEENYIFNTFFSSIDVNELSNVSSISLNSNTSDAVGQFDDGQSSGSTSEGSFPIFGTFLDGLKMTLAFLSILTPLPILAFVNSLGLPLWLMVLFVAPLGILYVIALFEFVGNRIL